ELLRKSARFACTEFTSGPVDQLAVGHACRANGLAGPTGQAAVQMLDRCRIGFERSFQKALDKRHPTAWRIAFLALDAVGRAVRETHLALHATGRTGFE